MPRVKRIPIGGPAPPMSRQAAIAQHLLQQGSSSAPVGSITEGVTRAAQGALGGFLAGRADEQAQSEAAAAQQARASDLKTVTDTLQSGGDLGALVGQLQTPEMNQQIAQFLMNKHLNPEVAKPVVVPAGAALTQGGKVLHSQPHKPPKSDILSPEALQQKKELAAVRGRAAGAGTANLARVMAQARLDTERLKQEEMRGKIETRQAKLKRQQTAEKNARRSIVTKAKIITTKTAEARKLVTGFSTGLTGQALAGFGGTEARNLKVSLDTIKANLAFDQLAAMRAASPTGGALGAVSERELTLLEAAVSSLDQAQTAEQLLKALDDVDRHYKQWAETIEAQPIGQQEDTSGVIDFSALPDS